MALTYTTPEAVFAKIQLALETAGFQGVDRQKGLKIDNYAYPGCFINDVMQTRKTLLRNVIDVTHFVSIPVFEKDTAGTMHTTLNGIIQTALAALKADPTWGGLCMDGTIERVTTDEGFYAPYCVAIIQLKLNYLARN